MEEDEKLLKTVFEILHSHYIRRESDELLHPPVKGAATPEPGSVKWYEDKIKEKEADINDRQGERTAHVDLSHAGGY